MDSPARYICLSGGEGSGKTTVIKRLQEEFPDFLYVREPGGTPFGQTMRAQLLERRYAPNPWVELFLLMADRMELYERIVRPGLAAGKTVVSDRCWIETLVYQVLSKIGSSEVPAFLALAKSSGCPMPDLWLWFDLDPKLGLARRTASGDVNSFDADALELHQRYRRGFAEVGTLLPQLRQVRIDAVTSPDEVYAAAKTAIMNPT